MSLQQKVFNAISNKTNLKSTPKSRNNKVSLSKLDDLKTYRDNLKSIDESFSTSYRAFYDEWSNIITLKQRLDEVLADVQSQSEDADSYIQEALDFSTTLISELRDYGVDPNSISEFQEITDIMANLEDNVFQAKERFQDVQNVISVI